LHDEEIIVTEARLKLKKLEKEKIQKQIDENIKWRNEKQPQLVDFPSCGSVFKKIEGVGAGRLIEKSGLKGYRVGGIQVSEKHANYLVNTGNATASDVVKLIKTIQDKVLEETGYKLETEIKMIGEF
jgi:UDP-N-acetylmuramate dehydrogenase